MYVQFGPDKVKADPVDILPNGNILLKALEFHPRFGFGHTFQVPPKDLIDKLPKDFTDAMDTRKRAIPPHQEGYKQNSQKAME
jgi:hypothetical protein